MGNGYIELGVRRTTHNLLFANLVLLAGVLVVVLLNGRYLYNYAYGPFSMDREALLSLKDPDALLNYWVTVQADRVTDTGVDAFHVLSSRNSTTRLLIGRYMMANFGSLALLVKAPTGYTGTSFTGALQLVAHDEEADKINNLLNNVLNRDEVLPFMLDATDFRAGGTIWVILGILLTAVGLWNLWKVVRRTVNPDAHPLYQALSAYGPVASMAAAVDTEVTGGNVMRFGKKGSVILTPHWLLDQSTFSIKAVHLDDLVWAYMQEMRGRFGAIYSVVLWTAKGTHTVIHENSAAHNIMQHIQQYAPWAQVGYTPELAKTWRRNRQGLMKEVADRQRAIKAQLY